jgi:hypothetical protein
VRGTILRGGTEEASKEENWLKQIYEYEQIDGWENFAAASKPLSIVPTPSLAFARPSGC